jgi:hypothetical protein
VAADNTALIRALTTRVSRLEELVTLLMNNVAADNADFMKDPNYERIKELRAQISQRGNDKTDSKP